jgi:hypothetical protein
MQPFIVQQYTEMYGCTRQMILLSSIRQVMSLDVGTAGGISSNSNGVKGLFRVFFQPQEKARHSVCSQTVA